MTLPLSSEIVRAAYDYLNATPPFDKWNLPDGDDIVFRIAKSDLDHGWVDVGRKHKKPKLTISGSTVGHSLSLFLTVAHEMVHLHQYLARLPVTHGRGFRMLAVQVCKFHGFDPKSF